MSRNCPDPSLLVAYLDRTLFHRDAEAVDRHVETCAECTALLAAMRQKRAAEQAAKTARWRMGIGAGIAVIVLAGYGIWLMLPRSSTRESARETSSAPAPPPPSSPIATVAPSPAGRSTSPEKTLPRDKPVSREKPAPREKPKTSPEKSKPVPKPAAPRVRWRTRDLLVESSTDDGETWVADYTADRQIRASVFVNESVAWVVGDNGLILRRTKNGWFGASPPADGNITAVRATSPSKATVTLEDGRAFTTANGGVTWSSAP